MNCCTHLPADYLRQTCIYSTEQNYRLPPLAEADAEQQLTELLRGYWQGLQQPLPFFPKSAWAMYDKGKVNIDTARAVWTGTDYYSGEQYKTEYALLYRAESPFDDPQQAQAFMDQAEQVVGKLFAVRQVL